jgi:hypothetical protein
MAPSGRAATSRADQLFADDGNFIRPLYMPQRGKQVTIQYLPPSMLLQRASYVREVVGSHDAILEFKVEIDGIEVNGVDMMAWNDDGRITEFKVMLRLLKAINLIHQKMGEMLAARR